MPTSPPGEADLRAGRGANRVRDLEAIGRGHAGAFHAWVPHLVDRALGRSHRPGELADQTLLSRFRFWDSGSFRPAGSALRKNAESALLPQPGGFERCYWRLGSRSRHRARSRSRRSSSSRKAFRSPTKALRARRSSCSCASKLRMRLVLLRNTGHRALHSSGRVVGLGSRQWGPRLPPTPGRVKGREGCDTRKQVAATAGFSCDIARAVSRGAKKSSGLRHSRREMPGAGPCLPRGSEGETAPSAGRRLYYPGRDGRIRGREGGRGQLSRRAPRSGVPRV
jgi:hypothetical protein